MDRYFDHWERLVGAVMRREELRQLSLEYSRSPSTRSTDSDFSLSTSSSRYDDLSNFRPTPSPLHPDAVRFKLAQSLKLESGSRKFPPGKRRTSIWKGLSIFSGGSASKKDCSKKKGDVKWANAQTTLNGLQWPVKLNGLGHRGEAPAETAGEDKRRAEMERLQELHTLKGHIESLVKAKGLDVGSISHYYTV